MAPPSSRGFPLAIFPAKARPAAGALGSPGLAWEGKCVPWPLFAPTPGSGPPRLPELCPAPPAAPCACRSCPSNPHGRAFAPFPRLTGDGVI